MRIVHISDTHGAKYHSHLEIPECDVVICSGDLGGRTDRAEFLEFLIWFEKLPAKRKIFCGGNHDICLDPKRVRDLRSENRMMEWLLASQAHRDCMELIKSYDVTYLQDQSYEYEGVNFYASPYSPSFHRNHWVFNADRGQEIQKIWSKIPADTNVLITHTPPYGILDAIEEKYKKTEDEDVHRGCQDLLQVIKARLFKLQLHCFGHIHDQVGMVLAHVSNKRRVLFSNGAIVSNGGEQLISKPLIITI